MTDTPEKKQVAIDHFIQRIAECKDDMARHAANTIEWHTAQITLVDLLHRKRELECLNEVKPFEKAAVSRLDHGTI